MYRDSSNYKFYGEFIVDGLLKPNDLKEHLLDKEFFVPHEVGLDHLLNLPMNQDDHYLHTFESFEPTDKGISICSSSDFIKRIKKANTKGWLSTLQCFS